MRLLRVKPEGFKYFHNTKTYYLTGTTLQPSLEGEILIPEGTVLQFFLNKEILGGLDLAGANDLLIEVESIVKEVFSAGRIIWRFTAVGIDENDNRKSD